jgi:hypothetical protein
MLSDLNIRNKTEREHAIEKPRHTMFLPEHRIKIKDKIIFYAHRVISLNQLVLFITLHIYEFNFIQ